MAYFSRLTDIVTCNLTEMLSSSDDPDATLREIIAEMEEGLKGAERSVATAKHSQERTRTELGEEQRQIQHWGDAARTALKNGDESKARLALIRKQEAEDLAAGLEQQLNAATSTVEHLTTMQRALEARLSDAKRRLAGDSETPEAVQPAKSPSESGCTHADKIEAELEALRREIESS